MRSGETEVTEVPIPAVRPGTALVQTAASLVSAGTERMLVEFAEKSLAGKAQARPDLVAQMLDKARREGLLSTLEAAFNRLDQPMLLGYSSAGTIRAVGPGLRGFRAGDRVACAGGGYAVHAEFAVIPQNLMVHLPDSVDFESAAFATLAAIAMHGVRLSGAQLGDRVAVIGLGLLGLLTAGILHASGCQVLGIDLEPQRVALAGLMGAEGVLRPQAEEAAAAFSKNHGADAVLICADSQSDDPVELAGAIARDRAKVVAVGAVGLGIPRKLYYEKELDFLVSRSYGPGRYDPEYEEAGHDYPIGYVRWTEGRNLEAFIDLLGTQRLDVRPLITHRIAIEDAVEAYALITRKSAKPFMGVLLTYSQGPQPEGLDHRVINHYAAAVSIRPGEILALGVLGAGVYGNSIFLPVVRQAGGVAPIGIVSASGVSAQHAAHRFGFGYASSSEEQVLSDPSINIIAILTRHQHHARQILAALKAGKRVYCEKPLAITQQQLDEITDYLGEGGHPLLTVGFNRRFAPMALRLKEFASQRSEPMAVQYRVNAGYLPASHWLHDPQQGGGRIIGEACHFIDFLTYLVGANPVTVSVSAMPDQNRYLQDNVILTLTYPDGSLGTISYLANGDKAFGKERVEVFSSGWSAVLDDFRSLELVRRGKRRVSRAYLRQDKGHRPAWETFIKACREGGPPPIPYDQLITVTKITLAAVEALQRGQTSPLAIPSTSPAEVSEASKTSETPIPTEAA